MNKRIRLKLFKQYVNRLPTERLKIAKSGKILNWNALSAATRDWILYG